MASSLNDTAKQEADDAVADAVQSIESLMIQDADTMDPEPEQTASRETAGQNGSQEPQLPLPRDETRHATVAYIPASEKLKICHGTPYWTLEDEILFDVEHGDIDATWAPKAMLQMLESALEIQKMTTENEPKTDGSIEEWENIEIPDWRSCKGHERYYLDWLQKAGFIGEDTVRILLEKIEEEESMLQVWTEKIQSLKAALFYPDKCAEEETEPEGASSHASGENGYASSEPDEELVLAEMKLRASVEAGEIDINAVISQMISGAMTVRHNKKNQAGEQDDSVHPKEEDIDEVTEFDKDIAAAALAFLADEKWISPEMFYWLWWDGLHPLVVIEETSTAWRDYLDAKDEAMAAKEAEYEAANSAEIEAAEREEREAREAKWERVVAEREAAESEPPEWEPAEWEPPEWELPEWETKTDDRCYVL